ncbi:MAG: hypothetical protein JRG96_08110 [Deltaproteobacteria bacterium]|nr:hypothetical protein [Deltaproteobacteria bacterium]MBW2419321.1 hypothetical protein [Deltaproteobacteria bacterium]
MSSVSEEEPADPLQRFAAALQAGKPPPLRGERFLRTSLRTLHILAFGVYFGGHVYGVEPERLIYGLAAVVSSGGAFAAFEIWRAPVWLLQLRGTVTFLKILLLLCIGLFWEGRIPLMILITVGAVVSSHMPARYRYYSPFLGRVLDEGHKG